MARMAGTEPEANHSTDIVANNKEVTVTPSKLRKWRAGAKLEARSTEGNDQWFMAKVQDVDRVNHRVLIHYIHWNSRHDEWVPANSERLRPLRSNRLNGSFNGSLSPNTIFNNSADPNLPKDLKTGDRVMATWKLNRKYPAIVIGYEHDSGSYLVEFFDGVQSKVKPTQLRKLRKGEENLSSSTNGEGIESETEADSVCETVVVPQSSPKGRRERKRKFDVKALLKMRPGFSSSPLSPPLSTTTERTATPSPTPSASSIPEVVPSVNKTNKTKTGGRRNDKITSRTKLTDATKDKVELHIDKPNKKDNQKNTDKIPKPKVKSSNKEIKKANSDKPRDKGTPVGKSSSVDKPTNRSKAIIKDKSAAKVSGKTKQVNGKPPENVKLTKQKNSTVQDAKKKGVTKSKSEKVPRKGALLENGEDEVVVNAHSTVSEKKLVKKEAKVKRTKGDGSTVKDALLISKPTKPKISKKRKRPDDETSFDEDAPLAANSNEVVTQATVDSATSSGKRERKKKKFWDDEDSEQLVVKQRSSSKSAAGTPTPSSAKSRRQTKLNELELNSPSASQDEEDSLVPKANGRPLRYLAFDLSSDPKTIADKMVEGFNIPGPGEPIPIDSSRLPKGWTKLVVQRGIGITKGKWDVFVQNSSGRSFRSKTELQRHLDEIKSLHTSEEFEFSLDERLKRLRQIWKQHIVNSTSEDTSGAASLKKSHQTASTGEASSSKIQEKNRTNVINNPKNRKSEPIVVSEPVVLHLPSISVESETGQGLRCSIEKCGKLFRNDRLLQQHVKHYHPEIFDQVIATVHSPTGSSASSPPDALFQVPNDYEPSGPLSPLSHLQSANSERRRCATLNDLDSTEAEFTPGLKKRKSSLMVDLEAASITSKKKLRAFEFPQKGSGPGRPLNKRYFSEGSASSPTNNNSVSEKELTNYEIAQSGGRTRTDSILSVGSSVMAPSEDGEILLGLKRRHQKNLPPTPPTFRLSKRREAQLGGSDRRLSRRRPFFSLSSRDDDSGLVSPEILTPMSGYHMSMAPGSTSYPASEMDTSVTSEHLTSEEVVHCSCQRREEDGLMIQCDICLCWQHGICLGVEDEEKVPEKYICETCRHPRGGRASSKYTFDHDWLKEGKLPASRVEAADDDAFKILSDLMADLSNLSKDLHAIRLKLQVASQPNNPKVFMWSNVWDPPNSIQSDNLPKQSQDDKLTVETLTSFDVDESKNGHLDSQAVIDKLKFHLGNGMAEKLIILDQVIQDASCNGTDDSRTPNGVDEESYTPPSEACLKEWSLATGANETFPEEDTGTASNPISKQNGDANPSEAEIEETSSDAKSNEETSTSTPLERTVVNGEMTGSKDYKHLNGSETPADSTPKKPDMSFIQDDIGSHLEDVDQLDGGADQAFDPTLIPTFSEMAQLLPGVLEAIGSEGDTVANTDLTSTFQSITQQPLVKPSAPRDILFEPKRLDRDECRLNLLDHVANLQNEVSARLSVIESALVNMENGVSEIPVSRSGLVTLLRDVDVTRQLVWSI